MRINSLPKDRYIVAVSGGVDSVVLLDLLRRVPGLDLIVAHFDHGIRDNSADDAKFVGELAEKYGLPFETKREELGKDASEELARERRYEFLQEVAGKYEAKIITAHHMDDVIETIAINIKRGTGWRGLAAMDSEFITRPLTHFQKSELVEYAKNNNLSWHEDLTNVDEKYLRNKLRKKLSNLEYDKKLQLLSLWESQKELKREIDREVVKIATFDKEYPRDFFSNLDPLSAMECLRYITKARLTRPQILRALVAIKAFLPSKIFDAGNGVNIKFTARNFTVELIK